MSGAHAVIAYNQFYFVEINDIIVIDPIYRQKRD